MKTNFKYLAILASLCVAASAAVAGGVREIGTVNPASPTSAADEVDYVNRLAGMRNDTPDTATITIVRPGPDQVFTLDIGTGVPNDGSLPENLTLADHAGQVAASAPNIQNNYTVNTTGFIYLLVKWGNISEVYYVKGLTSFTASNDTGEANGVSHTALIGRYTPTDVNTPDGGSSAVLLGLGMLGLAGVSRLRKK